MTVVAYLICSHTLPEQVVRLVRTIRELSPSAPVLVHHDASRARLDAAQLRAAGGVTLVDPVPVVEWGRGSQLDMLLRGLSAALAGPAFDWLTVLSGQDYPLRPLAEIERDLARSSYDGFVEGHVVAPPAWSRAGGDEFARRYFYAWHRLPGTRGGRRGGVPGTGDLARRLVAAARPVLALRDVPSGVLLGHRTRTPFGPGLPCRRGSDWLTLSRPCVAALDAAARERGALLRHFRRTVLPTEAFPHTVLHAAGFRLSGDVRRFTAWEPSSPHPRVLRREDLPAALASTADFARKFDARVDAAALDELDRALRRATGPAGDGPVQNRPRRADG